MLKAIITIGTIQVLAILINLIRSKLVAVTLGPEGVGIISTVDQIVQLAAQLSALSIPFAAVKFLSKSHSEGDDTFRKVYSGFLQPLLALSVTGMLVGIGLVLLRPEVIGTDLSRYKTLLVLALLSIPTMVLGNFFIGVLAAARKSTASAMMAVVTSLVLTTSTCAGILVNGILGLYIANACAGAALTIATLVYFRKSLHLPLYEPTVKIFEELKRSSGVVFFSFLLYLSTFTYLLSFLVARYFVLKNFGEGEAGLLQAVMAIGLSLGMVFNPANGLFLTPIMNRNIPKAQKMLAAREFQKKLVIILGAVAVPILLFPQVVLTLLFSARFAVATQFVSLFVIWQFVLQVAGVYQALLIGFDDLKPYAAITCAGYLSSALLCWLVVGRYGILGVSVVFIFSTSLILIFSFARLKSKHGFSVPIGLHSLMLYCLLSMFVIGALSIKLDDWKILFAFTKIGVYIVFLAGLLFFLNKEERSSLYDVWSRIRLGNARRIVVSGRV
jgi:O-antigen/teichoic acid export membrane protein